MEDTVNGHVKNSELKEIASIILGEETLNSIIEWFLYIAGKKQRFVVFVVRRCYLLALIIARITGWEITDNGQTAFLTDAAFYLQCKTLVEYFLEHGTFPSILLVDDILIHGRNLNKLIQRMEDEICLQLKSIDPSYNEAEIKASFQEAIGIEVYTCAQGALLLWEEYKRKLNYRRIMRAKYWRQLSSDISTLILSSDITNACYIFTEHISDKKFDQIYANLVADGYEKSVYQSTIQYAKVHYLEMGKNIKAVYTLRIIKNSFYKGYRVAPFVFLPTMTKTETELIQKDIFRRINVTRECRDWIESLNRYRVKRSRNELLSMILSHGLLQEFNSKYDVKTGIGSESWSDEFNKLSRNYNSGISRESTVEYLKEILQNKLYSENELDELFCKCLSEKTNLINFEQINDNRPVRTEKEIFRWEEDHFYQRGYKAEQAACDAARQPYLTKTSRLEPEKQFKVEIEFNELFQNVSRDEIGMGVSCFLQLMDAGVLGISASDLKSEDADKEKNVEENTEEYCQYVKYGEQALLIQPLRYYEYIPMLAMMQRKCEQWGWKIEEEFDRFLDSEYCDIPKTSDDGVCIKSIRTFLEDLSVIDQQSEDWNGNYLFRKVLSENGESVTFTSINIFRTKMNEHISHYSQFIKSRGY